MIENAIYWYTLLLRNLTFSVYATKQMDIFILKEQLGCIPQALFSLVLGVKGDTAFRTEKQIPLALSYYALLLSLTYFHPER